MPYTPIDRSTAEAAFSTTAGEPRLTYGETLLEMRTELLAQLGNRDDVDAARLDKWINWAYQNLCGMLQLKVLRSSAQFDFVAGQPFYLLPDCVAAIEYLSVVDASQVGWGGRELELIDLPAYRMLPDASGKPTSWFRAYDDLLVVYPTPDESQTGAIEFRVRPLPLVGDTDCPILPAEFREPLLLSARHRACRSLLMFQQAQQAMNDFLACLRPLLDNDALERGMTPSKTFAARSHAQLYRSR